VLLRAFVAELERRGSTSSSYLRAGAAMVSSMSDVPPDLFPRFVSQLQLDGDYRGADGIGWAQVITPGEVPEFERRGRAMGWRDFAVNPAPKSGTKRLVPVTFLQPDTVRNRRAMGYDMYSQPTRREAMDEAERSARPTATGKVVLVQEGGVDAPGFLIYMPVYRGAGQDRRLRGFIYSPFNAQDFLESALELENRGEMGVRLYDRAASPESLLAQLAPSTATGITVTEQVLVANRPMLLVLESAQGPTLSRLSLATLMFGLLVATLLLVLARILTAQAQESEALLQWHEEQSSIRDSLTRELNHRVKNTLANVLSIIALTRRRAETIDEFAEGLDGRIRALSATHDLLTQSEWGATPIRAVIEAEMAPYALGSSKVLHIAGPHVELAPSDALSLGLAVHELATNAAKYGALSQPGGAVRVDWVLQDPGHARLRWREEGGPPVESERKRGFGTELLERIVAHQLGSPVELEFAPEGVRCSMIVPVREARAFAIRATKPEPRALSDQSR
ncbi:MAG: CHASE domain-containing protein, partial [Sphingomonadaceae bacterium]|nr:CHASE domain-containing protein [Sphingomonadaceae bacterium]